MTNQYDRMVGEYLDAVRRATVDLPPDRRDDLLADLGEHIATARAELDPETEAGVRDILDRLGDPVNIAAEARLGTPPPPTGRPAGRARPGWPHRSGRRAPAATSRSSSPAWSPPSCCSAAWHRPSP
jgi:hypothetical protein